MDGIHSVHGAWLYPPVTPAPGTPSNDPATNGKTPDHVSDSVKKVLSEMQSVSHLVNTRLEYRYNETLRQMVVKVYDSTTDTLIKELPSAELQAVHARIREVLGVFLERNT